MLSIFARSFCPLILAATGIFSLQVFAAQPPFVKPTALAVSEDTKQTPRPEARWYQVDMLLVAYTDENTIGNEHWPVTIADTAKEELQASEQREAIDTQTLNLDAENDTASSDQTAQQLAQAELANQNHQWLAWWNRPFTGGLQVAPEDQLSRTFAINPATLFDYEGNRINRKNGMQVIWQGSWQQDIQSREITESINIDAQLEQLSDDAELDKLGQAKISQVLDPNEEQITGGQTTVQKQALIIDVQGEIKISRSRYLHIDTDLVLKHAEKQLIKIKDSIRTEIKVENQVEQVDGNTPATPLNLEQITQITEEKIVPLRSAEIKQKRRMRSGEIHYLDHPLVGVLIKVTPLAEFVSEAEPEDDQL